MVEKLLEFGVQYLIYFLELGLLVLLLRRKPRGQLAGLCAYVSLLFVVDAVGRPFVLNRYGLDSPQYGYFFYLTDALLVLGAFLLVCSFFRRACAKEEKLWRSTRLFLVFVLILVPGITLNALSHNYDQFFTKNFIYEFSQNLYFTCLILNTLLYLLMQQIESADYELGLLVCGMGIQFAGPAASFALQHLTSGQDGYAKLHDLIAPFCTLGMLLTWLYAISKAGRTVPVFAAGRPGKALATAEVSLSDTE
jgi:hypothetical protein